MKKSGKTHPESCPCNSGLSFTDCCQPYVEQCLAAPTAEALMRSRYTAFALSNERYLHDSWHPDTRPIDIWLNAGTTWLGLEIIRTTAGGPDDVDGQVEFVARSKNGGKASRLHENSLFTRYEGRWVYVNGEILSKK